MTAFKTANDTLSTDFLLIWIFGGLFATIFALFIGYPLVSSILTLIVLIAFCYEEPESSIEIFHHLKSICFGVIGFEDGTEEASPFKEDECKKPPPGRFRFAKLLLTNQVPLMANYFEQRSQ